MGLLGEYFGFIEPEGPKPPAERSLYLELQRVHEYAEHDRYTSEYLWDAWGYWTERMDSGELSDNDFKSVVTIRLAIEFEIWMRDKQPNQENS